MRSALAWRKAYRLVNVYINIKVIAIIIIIIIIIINPFSYPELLALSLQCNWKGEKKEMIYITPAWNKTYLNLCTINKEKEKETKIHMLLHGIIFVFGTQEGGLIKWPDINFKYKEWLVRGVKSRRPQDFHFTKFKPYLTRQFRSSHRSTVSPRFELGSLDSESRVLTITPWDLTHLALKKITNLNVSPLPTSLWQI